MTNKIDIKVKVNNHTKISNDSSNLLNFNISGKSVNYILINTLRRVLYELVPIYSYNPNDIIIEKNTSIFNNDYMRLRLSNFPIWSIDNDRNTIKQVDFLEKNSNINSFDKKNENIETQDEYTKRINIERANVFTMKIDIKNTTNTILNVTTANAQFIYKGKFIDSPYKKELLIIKLKPNEEFNAVCYSSLHIPLKNINYSPVAGCYYIENNENNFDFILESTKQIPEKELLIRVCLIVINKLKLLENLIIDRIEKYNININKEDVYDIIEDITPENNNFEDIKHLTQGVLKIDYESHTFGNLITRYLQDHPDILFAGYNIEQLLIKELTISYKTNGKNIKDVFSNVFNTQIKIFEELISQFEKI